MDLVKQANGKIERLTREQVAALTRPAVVRTPEEKRAVLRRATRGLRVGVRVTRSMYRPR
jgi:hypothetical protein